MEPSLCLADKIHSLTYAAIRRKAIILKSHEFIAVRWRVKILDFESCLGGTLQQMQTTNQQLLY